MRERRMKSIKLSWWRNTVSTNKERKAKKKRRKKEKKTKKEDKKEKVFRQT